MDKKTLIISGVLVGLALIFFLLSRVLFKAPAVATTNGNTNNLQPVPVVQQPIPTATPTAFPLNTATITDLSAQAKTEFDFALGKARAWKKDATPMAVVVKYSGSIDRSNGKDTYVFFSPSASDYYFTIDISQTKNASGQNDFQRVIYYRDDYFLSKDTVALPTQYFKYDYLAALQKADSLGGADVRAKNKNYDINMVLSSQTNRYIMWDVEYLVNGKVVLSVPYSAYTGTTDTPTKQ